MNEGSPRKWLVRLKCDKVYVKNTILNLTVIILNILMTYLINIVLNADFIKTLV